MLYYKLKSNQPSFFYSLGMWKNWRKRDWNKVQAVQKEILKPLFSIWKIKPCWGLFNAFGQ